MKVELVKPIPGKAYFEGDVIELSDADGRAWCESGHAIPAKEKATAPKVETAESQQALTASNAQSVVSNKRAKTKR